MTKGKREQDGEKGEETRKLCAHLLLYQEKY